MPSVLTGLLRVAYVGIANSFNGAIDIAVDPQGNIYTMDIGNGLQQCQGDTIDKLSSYTTFIYKFNPQGTLLSISRVGALSGDFYGYNLETDDAGSVYVLGQPNGVTSIIINDDTVAALGNTNQLIKIDANGNFAWKINTGAATNGNGCMLQYSEGYIYYQSGDLKVSKIDTDGNIGASLSASFYSSPTASTGVIYKGSGVFSNGDILLAAISSGRVAFGTDTLNNIGNPAVTRPVLLVRCDTNMNVVWARYASNVRDPDKNFLPIAIDSSDAVYVGVQVNFEMIIGNDTIGAQGSIFTGEGGVIKIDAAGNDVWARALPSTSTCYAWCMTNTTDNTGILVGGGYTGVATLGSVTLPIAPNGLPFMGKLDANGNFSNVFGYLSAPSQTDALCLEPGSNGTYYVGGKLANATVPVFSCTPIAPAKGFYLGAFTEQPDTVPSPSIVANGALLTATPPFAGNIQWFLNGNVLNGENGQTITATQDGDYSVSYAYSTGCADTTTSTVQSVVLSSVSSTDAAALLRVYPNPSKGVFQIKGIETADATVTVRNMLGATVYYSNRMNDNRTIDLTGVAAGAYFMEVLQQEKTAVLKICKQ
ncbi:MAG: T9SS type A sorting domain-containing protein [Bacteroidetes bacterium]|nr:T9SS type A sorting domain-containing protein [Bacteroidota bacterium]